MPEFVEQNNNEQSEIFEGVPHPRRIEIETALDLKDRDQEPGPMEKNVDSTKAKEVYGTLAVHLS